MTIKTIVEQLEAIELQNENLLQLIEDAYGGMSVRRHFRHNDRNNDFTGSEDDEQALSAVSDTLAKALEILRPLAGY